MTATDFFECLKSNAFLTNQEVQLEMQDFAFESEIPIFILLLWQCAENNPQTIFSIDLISQEFIKNAIVDDILLALDKISTVPVRQFSEIVFATGTVEQIAHYKKIRDSWGVDANAENVT